MNILCIYNEVDIESQNIQKIFGKRKYGSIKLARSNLKNYFESTIKSILQDHDVTIKTAYSTNELNDLSSLKGFNCVFMINSDIAINPDLSKIELQKIILSGLNILINLNNSLNVAWFFSSWEAFNSYLRNEELTFTSLSGDQFLINLAIPQVCLDFVSGKFDTRYFNQIISQDHFLIKRSSNIQKIKNEADYYYLLPPNIQSWFVQPFDYTQASNLASYKMERLQVASCATLWIHSSLTLNEFDQLIKKSMVYINSRTQKNGTHDEYLKVFKDRYIDKVKGRLEAFKQTSLYPKLNSLIGTLTAYNSIDDIYSLYFSLIDKKSEEITKNTSFTLALGHGDFCFSNILYDPNTQNFKLIDPRGGSSIEELFDDPLYDIAKLSHSVLGNYDWINSLLFNIKINPSLGLSIDYDFEFNNIDPYKVKFISRLKEYGYSIKDIRLLEASLFLSMLPLHIDYPNKILGFLLNALEILEEVKKSEYQ